MVGGRRCGGHGRGHGERAAQGGERQPSTAGRGRGSHGSSRVRSSETCVTLMMQSVTVTVAAALLPEPGRATGPAGRPAPSRCSGDQVVLVGPVVPSGAAAVPSADVPAEAVVVVPVVVPVVPAPVLTWVVGIGVTVVLG